MKDSHRLSSLPQIHLPDLIPSLSDLSELSRASGSWLATLGVGLAVGLPMTSAADPLEETPEPAYIRWLSPDSERPPEWMGENVFYKKGAGLEYRHEAKFGATPVELGLQGPLVRGKKDSSPFPEPTRPRRVSGVGLAFEVRF
jgi:hypothetical protein